MSSSLLIRKIAITACGHVPSRLESDVRAFGKDYSLQRGRPKAQPVHSIYQWHRSYYLYYRKHFAKDYFFLFNWFYYLAMVVKLC